MPQFRVTWQFRSASGSTWNEVYYTDATNASLALDTTPSLRTYRLALLHPANTWVGIRSAQVDAARVTGFLPLNFKGQGGAIFNDDAGPDVAGTALVLSLAGTNGGSRKLWLRGIPDSYSILNTASGDAALPAPVLQAIKNFVGQLAINLYGLRQVQPPGAGALANIRITSIDGHLENGTSTITTSVAPLYAPNSRIIISGASPKDLPGLNGRWSILGPITGSTFVIGYQTPLGQIITPLGAKCRQETFNPTNVFIPTSNAFLYIGTRKTKNAVSRSRGARRAIRLRTSL